MPTGSENQTSCCTVAATDLLHIFAVKPNSLPASSTVLSSRLCVYW